MIPYDPDLPRPIVVLRYGTVFEDRGRGLVPVRSLVPSEVIPADKPANNSRAAESRAFRLRMAHVQANLFLAAITLGVMGLLTFAFLLGGRR